MFTNRAPDGTNNICGKKVKQYRKALGAKMSQRLFAEEIQRLGCDLDKNMIQRIESGERFVTDIELKVLAKALGVSYEQLLDS